MSRTSIELQPSAVTTPEAAHTPADLRSLHTEPDEDVLTTPRSAVSNETTVTSRGRSTSIIASISMVTGVNSMLNGVVAVILPTLQKDLHLSESLLLWPAAINALTCGCSLLLAGSIADALGAKAMYMVGALLQAAFVLGCGLSRNGYEIVLFRGLAGIAISFCLPSAVSIITSSFSGRRRNVAFAAMGSGQPIGFSLGLVFGGVFTEFATWRLSFYLGAAIIAVNMALIYWALPMSVAAEETSWAMRRHRILHDIDWIGTGLASASLALFSYVFATISGNVHNIREPSSIVLLCIATALIPAFVFWVGRQERLGRPAIIPNSLWRNRTFTAICLAVFVSWGSFNALETIMTFFFQNVQLLSPLQASIRFLPAAASGIVANVIVGALVHRMSANLLANLGFIISCGGPLAMAFASPTSSYWTSGFIGNLLNPVAVDSLFTVANLMISSVFSSRDQALAGSVFNTVSQVGKSVGVALVAVISSSVTANSKLKDKSSPDALMEGYRATFWFCFALNVAALLVCLWGLRKIGKVGHKRD